MERKSFQELRLDCRSSEVLVRRGSQISPTHTWVLIAPSFSLYAERPTSRPSVSLYRSRFGSGELCDQPFRFSYVAGGLSRGASVSLVRNNLGKRREGTGKHKMPSSVGSRQGSQHSQGSKGTPRRSSREDRSDRTEHKDSRMPRPSSKGSNRDVGSEGPKTPERGRLVWREPRVVGTRRRQEATRPTPKPPFF